MSLERDFPARHGGIAPVLAPPECVSEYHGRCPAAGAIVRGRDEATEHGTDAQRLEKAAADPERLGETHLAARAQIQSIRAPGGDARKDALAVARVLPERVPQLGIPPSEVSRASLSTDDDVNLG